MPTDLPGDRRLPSLNAVRNFDAAARHLSFTLAARELCVTQGAVSCMVQALEAELGTALFLRLGRNLALTPAGVAYHPPIQEAEACPQSCSNRSTVTCKTALDPEGGQTYIVTHSTVLSNIFARRTRAGFVAFAA